MRTTILALALLAAPAALVAQATPAPTPTPSTTPHMRHSARPVGRISRDSATAIAKASVANATVQSSELEQEQGKWIYSFDMKVAGQDGVTEVNVDAMNGAVVGTEHESAAAEHAESEHEHAGRAHPRAKAHPAAAAAPAPAPSH